MTRIRFAQPFVPTTVYKSCNHAEANYSPKVNIIETENEFQLEMAVPGIKKEEINIKFDNGKLNVSYDGKSEEKDEVKYTHKEFGDRAFEKNFSVSSKKINSDAIEAKYQDGILTLVLPKREEEKAKPAIQIAVS